MAVKFQERTASTRLGLLKFFNWIEYQKRQKHKVTNVVNKVEGSTLQFPFSQKEANSELCVEAFSWWTVSYNYDLVSTSSNNVDLLFNQFKVNNANIHDFDNGRDFRAILCLDGLHFPLDALSFVLWVLLSHLNLIFTVKMLRKDLVTSSLYFSNQTENAITLLTLLRDILRKPH